MGKLVKEKKKLDRSDNDFFVKQIVYDSKPSSKAAKYDAQEEDDDDDEAPEAVSMTASKAEIISQIKSEREARRLEKEKGRQKSLALQSQNREARAKKAKETEMINDQISESEDDEKVRTDEKISAEITPLPENIFEAVISKKTRFESSEEDEEFGDEVVLDSEKNAEIRETIRQTRAKVAKRRLVQTLPYSVVEIGFNGKSRMSPEEIKVRRKISKSKIEMTGKDVRRIDSILDRARRDRTVPAVFSRQNSFY